MRCRQNGRFSTFKIDPTRNWTIFRQVDNVAHHYYRSGLKLKYYLTDQASLAPTHTERHTSKSTMGTTGQSRTHLGETLETERPSRQSKDNGSQTQKLTIYHIFKHVVNQCQRKYVVLGYGYTSTNDMMDPPKNILQHFINVNWMRVPKTERSTPFKAPNQH